MLENRTFLEQVVKDKCKRKCWPECYAPEKAGQGSEEANLDVPNQRKVVALNG